MRKLVLLGFVLLTTQAFAGGETCYSLSKDGRAFSRTPEVLCVENRGERQFEISLRTGLGAERTIATFNLDLLRQARCLDCNVALYGVANPSNSIFNELSVSFDGKRDLQTGDEAGTVTIGKNKFFYRYSAR